MPRWWQDPQTCSLKWMQLTGEPSINQDELRKLQESYESTSFSQNRKCCKTQNATKIDQSRELYSNPINITWRIQKLWLKNDISRRPGGNYSTFSTNIRYDSWMNWLEFSGRRSEVKVTVNSQNTFGHNSRIYTIIKITFDMQICFTRIMKAS